MNAEHGSGPTVISNRPAKFQTKYAPDSIAKDRALDALHSIDPNCPREDWHKIGRAAIAAGLTIEQIDIWSSTAPNYSGSKDVQAAFKTITPEGGTGPGTLFRLAKDAGWNEPKKAPAKPAEAPHKHAPGMSADEVWKRCEAATVAHPYIVQKHAAGVDLSALRVVPAGDSLTIAGQSVVGWLVVPAHAPDGTLQSLQFIPPPGAGKKLNLPGAPMAGASFTVGTLVDGSPINLNEGIAGAWSCWQTNREAAVSSFGFSSMYKVARDLRQRCPNSLMRIIADVGKESQCESIAKEVGGLLVVMPEGEANNFDANDLFQRDGVDALAALLERATEPPITFPLDVAFADQLPDEYEPPDELVEGVLTAGDGSVLYGDSNSGKTFLVIDMACSVARGVPWMGRKTEPGLVLYLAAESPASVRRRLQGYQKFHGVKVPNFAIVQSPIDLFDGDADTDKVIQLVRMLEAQRGQKVRLIIGDTLARLSAGANENAGQDMGLVVRRFDRIRTECKAHFLLIHHCGKNAAAGARGWSGIRAAVDTELEVSDSPTGRCCEVTKQRDLSTKGDRIGFRLDVVTLGYTKWGVPAATCVVVASDAPVKTFKRVSEVAGAVLEFLRAKGSGIKKRLVVDHFEGTYDSSAIYRELKKLVEAGQVHECVGIVTAATGGGAKGAN